ncbi:MAG: Gfo/Idh/MocA family oxidoreductase, partial [Gemmatimonadaceae bacterium]
MNDISRRTLIERSAAMAAGLAATTLFPEHTSAAMHMPVHEDYTSAPRLRFGVIGINHSHIYGMVDATVRGGGELVRFYSMEPELAGEFARRYPDAKRAGDERAILDDPSISLVLSSITPDQRAPLGIRVMEHGKDYLSDKPGMTSLAQLADARRVQKATKRIYSIMYSERVENAATVHAGELVKQGAIGRVIQTIGLGPH